jgi:superfamily I DNA/RNA helicase
MGARPSGFTTGSKRLVGTETIAVPARQWSGEQDAIFAWFDAPTLIVGDTIGVGGVEHTATRLQHLVVDAVAGSGKTTTLIEGVSRAPEQRPLVCAFNKRIADTLNERLQHTLATAKTLHGLGYGVIRRQWKGMPVAEGSARADQLTGAVVTADTPVPIRRLVSKLHTKAREMCPLDWDTDALVALALQFDCEPDEGWRQYDLMYVVERAAEALAHAATVAPTRAVGIDFADMVYLPLVWNLTAREYDLVVVDEAQDMTLAQLELAERVSDGRICIVGDRHQAIYGFRGADIGSLNRLKQKLGATELPLSTTYRCAQSIVARAQRLVPHIQARPEAPEGTVTSAEYTQMLQEAQGGDFILSRLNAPLVSATLVLLRAGKRARMAGRDIGANINTLITKLLKVYPGMAIHELEDRVDRWERQTVQKYAERGLLNLVDQTHDTAAMIRALAEDTDSTKALFDKLYWLFTDSAEEDQITLSSIHKAKGLERDRVWLLQESLYRREWSQAEANIEYVGITRAINDLRIVEGVPSLQRSR